MDVLDVMNVDGDDLWAYVIFYMGVDLMVVLNDGVDDLYGR